MRWLPLLLLVSCVIPTGMDFDNEYDIIEWVSTHIDYVTDEQAWGVADYWQTAAETLKRRKGDCEDFVILDMVLLDEIGVESFMVLIPEHAILRIGHSYWWTIIGTEEPRPDDIIMELGLPAVRALTGVR